MNSYDRRRRELAEWGLPDFGPTQEDVDEDAIRGDMQYEAYRQQQLDEESMND